jgi:lincosamide nucleotidyltransferase A/C/D/E
MPGGEVLEIVDHLASSGVDVWLDGGWAVDAALGEQTREHDDLDLVVELRHVPTLVTALREKGYVVGKGVPPKSIELVDASGLQVDVHPVVFDARGDGLYRMDDDEDWAYPAAGFAGEGFVLGRRVRCLTPEAQLVCHMGYAPHLTSYDDVWTLARRFDLPVPDEYRRSRDSYGPR